MCGIVGIVHCDLSPISPVVLKNMSQNMAHRGPDGEGYYINGHVGLAHKRLAIIDVSASGHQPMISNNNRYVIVYNGEVYNFQELRVELEAKGHQFHSRTDSEVVLEAFSEWGEAALNRFNGMFAFAIWDNQRRELFLARDRYGIKPLYYVRLGNVLLFASEIKSFLKHPAFQVELNKEVLFEYFTFQNVFTDGTFFKNVKMLPPGNFARFSAAEGTLKDPHSYWDFNFCEPSHPTSEKEYLEEVDRLFRQAVSRQLVSDVDVGAYLSGGMDSGSITALAARELPYMKTFTVGFDLHSASGIELSFDERERAEILSYKFRTEHYEMVLKSGDLERIMPRLTWHLEDPRVGQSYPNFYAAQLASKFVKVVLSGCGGDELFGGYPWRYYRAVVNDNFEHYIDKYYVYWQRLIDNQSLKKIFQPIWKEVGHIWTRDIFKNVFHRHAAELTRPEDYINHSLYFEAKTFLPGLLAVEDKLSMAHGLETRVPFLDNDLVDFAMKIPAQLKLGSLGEIVRINENEPGDKTQKFFKKNKDGKLLLRKVMSRYIPSEITNAQKQGFSAPDASWFRGDSIDYVRRELINQKAPLYDFLNYTIVQDLLNEHLEGKQNRRLFIWSLLNVNEWCKQFLGVL